MMVTGTQTEKNVLPLLPPSSPTQPSVLEFQKQAPFVTQQAPLQETMKPAPYSESDYRWLASVLELLIEIGNRGENPNFNSILRSDYRQLSSLLEELVDTVDENIHHPATSLMMLVGFLIDRYEGENLPKLSDLPIEPTEKDPVEWEDPGEILETSDPTPEEMRQFNPTAILEWSETEVAIHAFFSMGNMLSEGGWITEAISAYDMVLHLKPNSAETYYNRGTAKTSIAEYQRAIADFDEAIHLKPQFVEAYYNRGTAKLALNQRESACSDFRIASKLTEQPGQDNIKTHIAQCLQELKVKI